MRVAFFDPSVPGFPRELARGEVEGGTVTIRNVKPIEGRGLSFARRLCICPLEGGHIGRTFVMEIRGEDAGTVTLAEPFPLKG